MKNEKRFTSNFTNLTGRNVSGYAVVYNALSKNLGGFKERIAPGAFDKALKNNPDIVAIFNHDLNQVLARTTSKTLAVDSDKRGLSFNFEMPDVSYGNDILESIKRGDISGCSFEFRVAPGGEHWQKIGSLNIRTITEISDIMDVSLVTRPAYNDTSVSVRSLQDDKTLKCKKSMYWMD